MWSKREVTPAGSKLTDLIDLGLNRAKYASGCVAALIAEIKTATINKKYHMIITIFFIIENHLDNYFLVVVHW